MQGGYTPCIEAAHHCLATELGCPLPPRTSSPLDCAPWLCVGSPRPALPASVELLACRKAFTSVTDLNAEALVSMDTGDKAEKGRNMDHVTDPIGREDGDCNNQNESESIQKLCEGAQNKVEQKNKEGVKLKDEDKRTTGSGITVQNLVDFLPTMNKNVPKENPTFGAKKSGGVDGSPDDRHKLSVIHVGEQDTRDTAQLVDQAGKETKVFRKFTPFRFKRHKHPINAKEDNAISKETLDVSDDSQVIPMQKGKFSPSFLPRSQKEDGLDTGCEEQEEECSVTDVDATGDSSSWVTDTSSDTSETSDIGQYCEYFINRTILNLEENVKVKVRNKRKTVVEKWTHQEVLMSGSLNSTLSGSRDDTSSDSKLFSTSRVKFLSDSKTEILTGDSLQSLDVSKEDVAVSGNKDGCGTASDVDESSRYISYDEEFKINYVHCRDMCDTSVSSLDEKSSSNVSHWGKIARKLGIHSKDSKVKSVNPNVSQGNQFDGNQLDCPSNENTINSSDMDTSSGTLDTLNDDNYSIKMDSDLRDSKSDLPGDSLHSSSNEESVSSNGGSHLDMSMEEYLQRELGDSLGGRMLEQILKDMYIDPELLEELDEEQKQVLFCKMREEQVRRYNEREKETGTASSKPKRNNKKGHQVDWRLDAKGAPWTWVMGEHRDDRTIEQILEDESHVKALQLATEEASTLEKEAEEKLRKLKEEEDALEAERKRKEEELRKQEEEAAVYASLKEAKAAQKKLEENKKKEEEQRKKIQQIKRTENKMRRQSSLEIEGLKAKRSSEIYTSIKDMRKKFEKEAEKQNKEITTEWKKQEDKAKRLEAARREIAKKARAEYQEYRRSLVGATQAFGKALTALKRIREQRESVKGNRPPVPERNSGVSITPKAGRPSGKDAIVDWFRATEMPKHAGIDPNTKQYYSWFHGMISRGYAEELLEEKQVGTYLVRVSERIFGYAISYRDEDRCKHYLINALDDQYTFFGSNQVAHATLQQIVEYHKTHPVSSGGGERLKYACGQVRDPPDYRDLISTPDLETTKL